MKSLVKDLAVYFLGLPALFLIYFILSRGVIHCVKESLAWVGLL